MTWDPVGLKSAKLQGSRPLTGRERRLRAAFSYGSMSALRLASVDDRSWPEEDKAERERCALRRAKEPLE